MGKWRLSSLDQCRGYAVVAMFLVNYAGEFQRTPAFLHHTNRNFGYPDSIMPLFFFCVGFAMRLNLRPMRKLPYMRLLRRVVGLFIIAFVLYVFLDQIASGWSHSWQQLLVRDLFQTLATIAVVTVYLLPVIRLASVWLIAYVTAGAVVYVVLSLLFYYDFAMTFTVIDGGPLGFLTWALPTAAGCWAWDIITMYKERSLSKLRLLLALSVAGAWLMLAGYLVNCLRMLGSDMTGCYYPTASCQGSTSLPYPPLVVPDYSVGVWDMGQKGSTLSYQLFSAGCSLFTYALFFLMCDWRNPLERGGERMARKQSTWTTTGDIEMDVISGEDNDTDVSMKEDSVVVRSEMAETNGERVQCTKMAEDTGEDGDATALQRESPEDESTAVVTLSPSESDDDLLTLEEAEYPGMDSHAHRATLQWILLYILQWLGVSELGNWRLGIFTSFGSNALLAYIWQGLLIGAISLVLSKEASAWLVWTVFVLFMALSFALFRFLQHKGWYLRI